MVSNHFRNLTELPVGSNHTPVAMGSIEHYGQVKLIVKLEGGKTYLAGESLKQQKEQLRLVVRFSYPQQRKCLSVKLYNMKLGWWSSLRKSTTFTTKKETGCDESFICKARGA